MFLSQFFGRFAFTSRENQFHAKDYALILQTEYCLSVIKVNSKPYCKDSKDYRLLLND